MDPRELKLPVWAQEKLAAFRREVSLGQAQVRMLRQEWPDGTNTVAEDSVLGQRHLGMNARVKFHLGPRERDWIEVQRRLDDGVPYLHVYGDHQLIVVPHVTNVLGVRYE
jgi:hypothetical protein